MESIALLVSFASFVLGVIVLIVFFVMASNVGSVRFHSRNMEERLAGIQSSLDRIIRSLEGTAPASVKDKAKAYDEKNRQ